MVHGARCMVHGARCTVHGARCTVHGAWCTVRGAWCMVHGAWCMVHGAWCMVHGAWCMVHGAHAGAHAWCMYVCCMSPPQESPLCLPSCPEYRTKTPYAEQTSALHCESCEHAVIMDAQKAAGTYKRQVDLQGILP